ncbi:MAG TPA: gamma-glutamyl-gamma-aminobutyrate hydrolase family protein [Ktedonobacteraceae bacterium]|jgi:putative glutamine amidotransferase
MHPSIGITCNPNFSDEANRWEYRYYLEAVKSVGGIPRLVSSLETLHDVRSQLDGLLLPGGCDVHPSVYGEKIHPTFDKCNHALDQLELEAVRWALLQDMPVLGICRGMQLLNVALGGTLFQDLADQYPGCLNHRVRNQARCHRVFVQPTSCMEQVVGTQEFWVNSRHHQAIREPGEGVCVTGLADDGVAELLEVPGYRLVIGAQCHPEEIYQDIPECTRLFTALVSACIKTTVTPTVS